jgi:aminoglycoside/choline kinase family phosphotransferase
MLKDLNIFTKIKALLNQIVFKIPKIKYEDEAVILFTS